MLGRWLNTGDSAVSKIFVLVWVPPKAGSEVRIWVREVHVFAELVVRHEEKSYWYGVGNGSSGALWVSEMVQNTPQNHPTR